MLRDITHAGVPPVAGLVFGTSAWLGLLEHPLVVSIISGVAVAIIVAHVMAVVRLFQRVSRAENAIEHYLRDHGAAEERQAKVTAALLDAIKDLGHKTENLGVLTEKIQTTEEEVERLRRFRHDVEKSYSVTVSLFRQVTDKIDAVLARAK